LETLLFELGFIHDRSVKVWNVPLYRYEDTVDFIDVSNVIPMYVKGSGAKSWDKIEWLDLDLYVDGVLRIPYLDEILDVEMSFVEHHGLLIGAFSHHTHVNEYVIGYIYIVADPDKKQAVITMWDITYDNSVLEGVLNSLKQLNKKTGINESEWEVHVLFDVGASQIEDSRDAVHPTASQIRRAISDFNAYGFEFVPVHGKWEM